MTFKTTFKKPAAPEVKPDPAKELDKARRRILDDLSDSFGSRKLQAQDDRPPYLTVEGEHILILDTFKPILNKNKISSVVFNFAVLSSSSDELEPGTDVTVQFSSKFDNFEEQIEKTIRAITNNPEGPMDADVLEQAFDGKFHGRQVKCTTVNKVRPRDGAVFSNHYWAPTEQAL